MKNLLFIVWLLLGGILSLNAQTGNQIIGVGAGTNITTGDENTLYGDSTGNAITTQSRTVLMGYVAGVKNISNNLLAIGYLAGAGNTEGFNNTLIGYEAGRGSYVGGNLSTPLTGDHNIAIGAESGEPITTGYNNTFIGEESAANHTTGYDNVFIGEDAGFSNTTGYRQVFIGNEVGISSDVGYANIGVGSESMSDVDDGHHNTALGDSALIDVGDGIYNTGLGQAASTANEWADYGTFIGARAGWDNNRTNSTANANRNTYAGFTTGFTNRDGQDNVGIGAFADYDDTNRSRCLFIGAQCTPSTNNAFSIGFDSFVDIGNGVGLGNNQDQRNGDGGIALGHGVLSRNTTAHSIAAGYLADFNDTEAKSRSIGIGNRVVMKAEESVAIGSESVMSGNNSVAIGDGVELSGINSVAIGSKTILAPNHEVFFGNAATTTIGSSVNWTATSDGRFKKNIQENIPGLAFINALRPVSYQFDAEKLAEFIGGKTNDFSEKETTIYSGFIAQEVEAAAQYIGYDFSGVKIPQNPESQIYGLRYAAFTVPLVKAVQELDYMSITQKKQLQNSLKSITTQREQINDVKRELNTFNVKLKLIQTRLQQNLEIEQSHLPNAPAIANLR